MHIKAKKYAVHLSDESMRCPFPMNCLCSTCRLTLIPGGLSASRKLSRRARVGSKVLDRYPLGLFRDSKSSGAVRIAPDVLMRRRASIERVAKGLRKSLPELFRRA